MQNTSQQDDFLLVFGFIILPKEYEVERNVVLTLTGVMSMISVIFNGIMLLVIMKDPFKQLRTITAILLAFNSLANLCISLVSLVDSVFSWSHHSLLPELVVYLNSCGVSFYVVATFLHTLNTYCTIVIPVRYAYLASKIRRIIVPFLGLTLISLPCAIIIPVYTIANDVVPNYLEGIITFVCVLLALLIIGFLYLYVRIFRALYARKQRFTVSFHIERSTPQGLKIMKKNQEVAKTLFLHVIFFMIATVPGTLIIMVDLHCMSCGESTQRKLAILFTLPCVYVAFVFHPLLWLCRLKSYKQAMKQTLSINRQSKWFSNMLNHFSMKVQEENRARAGTVSTML